LFAGDAFATVVADALRSQGFSETKPISLDAYKMSHHGSRGNNSTPLLKLVRCPRYLFSTSGERFKHPHDECVARVLVSGGKDLSLCTNYRRESEMLWDREDVVKKYHHEVVKPGDGKSGLAIELS
jgi:hypothetical protein